MKLSVRTPGVRSRITLGGLPGLVSAAIAAVVPLSGVLFLSPAEYAVWALLATLFTIFLLFDFGAPALAAKLATERVASPRAVRRVLLLTSAPPLLLAAVAAITWPVYSSITGLVSYSDSSVIVCIVTLGLGGALRSAGTVFAGISLGRQRFGRRATILLVPAIINAGLVLALLVIGLGVFALAIGVAASGAASAVLGALLERTRDAASDDVEVGRLVRVFLFSKGAATLMGLAVTQLDRWALGLVGDVSLLAQYDVVTRLVQIPKVALLAMLVGLVAEAASSSADQLKALWKRSTVVTVVLFAASQVAMIPLALLLVSANSTVTSLTIWLAVSLGVAQTALAATIPSTYVLAGRGKPHLELIYLAPVFILVILSYVLAIILSDGWLLVWLYSLVMLLGSVGYLLMMRAWMKGEKI